MSNSQDQLTIEALAVKQVAKAKALLEGIDKPTINDVHRAFGKLLDSHMEERNNDPDVDFLLANELATEMATGVVIP
tara:strand:- start:388 stop:618 length:231 start_codon:yes stop_codon:yes gene_type:complete